jgi:amino acid transporter/nucleotide-binding universal stress UspA family protein
LSTDELQQGYHPAGTAEYATSRPRVLGWLRSAAILDGDWGTSVAYVLGLGFALAGYASFWHLLAMMVLTSLVAINYITVCRLYPNGGGVYASLYHRSQLLAVVGALLLGADYIVTMALSVLDACHYLALDNPSYWAIGIIVAIGTINWFGPKHSGGLAIGISLATLATLMTIVIASVPAAVTSARIEVPEQGFFHNWGIFTGFVLSLSGIEAISNMTGLMKDPSRDSRRAILSVLAKVIVINVFLGLAMHAVQGLKPGDHLEDMLRFLGEHYVGQWFGWFVALSLGFLLISAGNTALNGLISVQFLMAVDRELPVSLRKLNRHGVPVIPFFLTTIAPIVVLMFVRDVQTMSHLYAIGVVGAITINLGSTATDKTVSLTRSLKFLTMVSAVVLFFVEISIAIEKTEATVFALIILLLGLGARQIGKWRLAAAPVPAPVVPQPSLARKRRRVSMPSARYLLALKDTNDRLLKFAIEEAKQRKALLFILRVKEIAVGALPEKLSMSTNGVEEHVDQVCSETGVDYQIISVPSYEVGYTIAEQAATFGVDRVILGATRRGVLENMLRGSVVRSLSSYLPEDVQLIIFGG